MGFSDDQLLDRIFETSPTGLVVLTPGGEITRCNQRAEQLLELEESNIEGKSYVEPEWTFLDPDGDPVPEADHPFVRVQGSRGPIFNQEYRLQRPHAETIDLSVSGAPIVEEDGTVERLVFAFENVSEQRERERQLRTKNEQLEILNRIIRHDIRNDLSVVLGWLDVVREDVEGDRGQQAVTRMENAGRHIVELTETARDLVDVVTGDRTLETEPVDLDRTLSTTVEIVRDSYPDADVDVEGSIPPVQVEATELLASVFKNLLNNAVQHNPADAPTVTVAVEPDGEVVRVSIADDGPGVPDDRKRAIFGKGEKGLESTSTGIGLYLVDTLVTQFGGEVRVEDNHPEGAVFVVELRQAT